MNRKRRFRIALLPLFTFLFSFFTCATAPAGNDDLDIAIRDTSDYLNDNIPKGNKIVILNIQSDHAALSEYVIDELIANAVNDKMFSVVDRAQLDQIRMELNFQLSGEVSDQSALEIGKFLGAQTIVSGTIGELADRHRMRIRALNVETAEVQGQYNRNINASRLITALSKGREINNSQLWTSLRSSHRRWLRQYRKRKRKFRRHGNGKLPAGEHRYQRQTDNANTNTATSRGEKRYIHFLPPTSTIYGGSKT